MEKIERKCTGDVRRRGHGVLATQRFKEIEEEEKTMMMRVQKFEACTVEAAREDCVYTRDVGVAAGHADMDPIWRLCRIGRCDCPNQWLCGRLSSAAIAKGVSFGNRGKFPRCERKEENNEKGETKWVC